MTHTKTKNKGLTTQKRTMISQHNTHNTHNTYHGKGQYYITLTNTGHRKHILAHAHTHRHITISTPENSGASSDDQGGEEVVNSTANGLQYLRTTWRVVIIKDTQSNSTDAQITWDQVFTSGVVKTNEEVGV